MAATVIRQPDMKTIYLIERYVINHKTGAWTLTSTSRFFYREKKLFIKDAKNQGYEYNHKEKAYILQCDPVESCYDRAILVKSYTI